MNKKRGRAAYTEEFRREAVRLVERDPSQLKRVARDLGVAADSLRTWWKRAQTDDAGPIVPPAPSARVLTLEEELRQLRRENERLREEREILKKATAFFAKENR